MNKNIFLFGSGTEIFYQLPNGTEYIKSTIFSKKSSLYGELRTMYNKFYKENNLNKLDKENNLNKLENTYCSKYIKTFHLNSESTEVKFVFNDIGKKYSKENSNVSDFFDINLNESIKYKLKNEVLDDIINSNDSYEILVEKYPFIDYIHTTGFIHENFQTLINPNKYGINKFWKIINYFWSCYFTILLPILENTPKYCDNKEFLINKYEYVLNNLEEIIDYLYGHDFKKLITTNGYNVNNNLCNYYQIIKKCEVNNIITTNYTPFADSYFDNVCYLAGKLNEFEFPQTFEIRSTNLKGMFFPYLSTQVPIKPLVHPKQIEEYSNALTLLKNTDRMFILGYSLNSLDDHINAIICDYIRCGGNIVYFEFVKGFSESYLLNYDSEEYIDTANLIRISKNYYKRFKVYKFNGSEEQFISILELEGLKSKEKELAYV